jgi:hypothetical protein
MLASPLLGLAHTKAAPFPNCVTRRSHVPAATARRPDTCSRPPPTNPSRTALGHLWSRARSRPHLWLSCGHWCGLRTSAPTCMASTAALHLDCAMTSLIGAGSTVGLPTIHKRIAAATPTGFCSPALLPSTAQLLPSHSAALLLPTRVAPAHSPYRSS